MLSAGSVGKSDWSVNKSGKLETPLDWWAKQLVTLSG
jgi:hypothetical protein